MATIRKIRSKWQVLIRKHNLKPIYKTFILKEDAVRWSGVKKRFHDTRHTFASRSTTSGWSITEIAAQGGWKQLQVLKRYTHIKAEYLAKKMV